RYRRPWGMRTSKRQRATFMPARRVSRSIVSRGHSLRAATHVHHRFDGRPAEAAVSTDSNGGQLVAGGVVVHRAHGDLQIVGDLGCRHHVVLFRTHTATSACSEPGAPVVPAPSVRSLRSREAGPTPSSGS